MYTLFIDTSNEIITVSLYDGFNLIKKVQESEYSHAVYFVPMINDILKENKLTVKNIKNIVAVNGPGSFTGLRIGLSVAKTMAYSLNIPIYLISSLTSYLVSSIVMEDKMCVIPDNKGYYISMFDKDNSVLLEEQYVTDISEYKNIYKVPLELDIEKVIKYALNKEASVTHLVRANYVKKIEVEK